MARKGKIENEKKKQRMVEKHAEKRRELKAKGDYAGLAKLPRNASPTRLTNRDKIDGRPRGVYRKFGLSRINLREKAHKGELPGVRKASW